jgi:S1-C subfamily serine protease
MNTSVPGLITAMVMLFTVSQAGSISETYKQVKGAVVVVNTNERVITPSTEKREVTMSGLGSGVLISDDGKILTASHVVHNADQIVVQFEDGEIIPAKVVSTSPATDLALIRLERMPDNPVIAHLGDSDGIEIGEQIFVVGAPYGISHSLTVGYISGKRSERVMAGDAMKIELIQTDAAINQGNSGGPMFNLKGEVVGIVSHILSQSGGFEGIGFAISSNLAREILLEQPFFWHGLEGFYLEGPLSEIFNLPQESGLLVQRVAAGSLGERMGIRGGKIIALIEDQPVLLGGDIILKVENLPMQLNYLTEIREKINGLKANDVLTITILRGGRIREITALKETP